MRALMTMAVLALAFPRAADAGDFCALDGDADAAMKAIEAFAKNQSKGKALEENMSWRCVELDAIRLKPRIERACLAILDRDGTKSPCATIAAAAGISMLGSHDLLAWVLQQPDDPLAYTGTSSLAVSRTRMLGRMGELRAAEALVNMWKTAIPRAAKNEKRTMAMGSWSVWRQHAAAAIGTTGGRDEAAFLEEQAAASKDRFVAKACRDAIATIEKRLTSPPK